MSRDLPRDQFNQEGSIRITMKKQFLVAARQAGFTSCTPAIRTMLDAFATILVNECASIALKSGSVNNKSELAVAEAQRVHDKIKAHFGLENT